MTLILDRISYPEPHLKPRNGVWRCRVYIPKALSALYGSTNYLEKTLNTSDEAIASRQLYRKANQIYDEFDQKQIDYQEHQVAILRALSLLDE